MNGKRRNIRALAAAVAAVLALGGCGLFPRAVAGTAACRYENADAYTADGAVLAERVEKLELHWLSGHVSLTTHGDDTLSLSEAANRDLSEEESLHYRLDGTTLTIQYCRSGAHLEQDLQKELTVCLPERLLRELQVDTVSAGITMEGVETEMLELGTVSGKIRLRSCGVTELAELGTVSGGVLAELARPLPAFSAGTVSGDIEVSAPSVTVFEAGTTSGSVALTAEAAPETVKVSTVSGAVTLCLPETAGFTLALSTVSGACDLSLPCAVENGSYICGDGRGAYRIDTTSGDVCVKGGGR